MGKSFKKAPLLEVLHCDIFSVFNPSLFLAWKKDLLEGFLNRHATQIVVLQQHKEIFKIALEQLSVFSKNYKKNAQNCLNNFFVLFEFIVLELMAPVDVLGILKPPQKSQNQSSNILIVIKTRAQRLWKSSFLHFFKSWLVLISFVSLFVQCLDRNVRKFQRLCILTSFY